MTKPLLCKACGKRMPLRYSTHCMYCLHLRTEEEVEADEACLEQFKHNQAVERNISHLDYIPNGKSRFGAVRTSIVYKKESVAECNALSKAIRHTLQRGKVQLSQDATKIDVEKAL